MSSKAPTEAVYRELRKPKKSKEEMAANKKAYQKERSKKMKKIAWWIPK